MITLKKLRGVPKDFPKYPSDFPNVNLGKKCVFVLVNSSGLKQMKCQ